jgi:uncharacterized protein with HEPN domain
VATSLTGSFFDAVRLRLIEIGEAVKLLDPKLVAQRPDIKWSDTAGMRDWLTHHYFDTSRAVVEATITEDLPSLEVAVLELQARLELAKRRTRDLSRDENKDRGLGH